MFSGQSRQDPYQKYLSLLWSLTGQKFRNKENPEDGLSCCGRWTWCPSGFDLVDILGIIYHSMPQDEELRRFFTRLIDAEMLRRTAQQNAEAADAKVAMATHQNQTASSLRGRLCPGRVLLRRQEAGGIGAEGVSGERGVCGDYEEARSGDMRHGGDGGCDVARNCLGYEDVEGGASDSSQTKRRSAWSGMREGSEEGRMAPVGARRTYGRMNNRKSLFTGTDKDKRKTKEEGCLKKQKKKSEQQKQGILRKAASVRKATVQCLEGQSQMLDGFVVDEDGTAPGGGESPNRNRTKRPEPVRVRSSGSYTICTSPHRDAATFKEEDAQWAADGADGQRSKKYSGHRQSSTVI